MIIDCLHVFRQWQFKTFKPANIGKRQGEFILFKCTKYRDDFTLPMECFNSYTVRIILGDRLKLFSRCLGRDQTHTFEFLDCRSIHWAIEWRGLVASLFYFKCTKYFLDLSKPGAHSAHAIVFVVQGLELET